MLDDRQILARLSDWLSPGDLSGALRRLLHVPEAWKAMHQPEFLDQVLTQGPDVLASPAALARWTLESMQGGQLSQPEPAAIPDGEQFWTTVEEIPLDQRDFATVAQIAQHIIKNDPDPSRCAEAAARAPRIWRAPMACAWPALPDQRRFAEMLCQSQQGTLFLIHLLLAQEEAGPAALRLLQWMPREVVARALLIASLFDHPFSLPLATAMQKRSQGQDPIPGPMAHIAGAIAPAILDGNEEELDKAWRTLKGQTATVAQWLARRALLKGQAPGALPLLHAAHDLDPDPLRNADLAYLMADQGEVQAAQDLLPESPSHPAEWIVWAFLREQAGDLAGKSQALEAALKGTLEWAFPAPVWAQRLVEQLLGAEMAHGASQVQAHLATSYPQAIPHRLRYCYLLVETGDPVGAANQAALSLALDPGSQDARLALATALLESGQAQDALAHWYALAATDLAHLPKMGEAALLAKDFELAAHAADRLLAQDPESKAGHLLKGRLLVARERLEEAREHLEWLTQNHPQFAAGWIALAECQQAAGDHEAAGQTLASAIQLLPSDPDLQHAYALWLEGQGRLTEAVEPAEKAVAAKATQASYRITLGNLLRKLGHHERALPILRQAVKSQPANWAARKALAETYEARQELAAAAQCMQDLPPSAPPQAFLSAGRIFLGAYQQLEDPKLRQLARHALDTARSKGCQLPELDLWEGLCCEAQGEDEKAFERYSRFLDSGGARDPALRKRALLGKARSSMKGGDIATAIETLEEARAQFPASTACVVELARAYDLAGNQEKALQLAQQATQLDPLDEGALGCLTSIAQKTGRWGSALQALERLVAIQPKAPQGWLRYARLAAQAGKKGIASHALAKALIHERRDPNHLLEAAQCALQLGRKATTRRLIRRAAQASAPQPELLRKAAKLAESAGDTETALWSWRQSAEIEPDNADALHRAAMALWGLGRQESAIALWQRAVERAPDRPEIVLHLSRALMAEGDVAAGMNLLRSAVERNPAQVGFILALAEAAQDHGDTQLAREMLQQAVRRAPQDPQVLQSFGLFLLRMRSPAQALEILNALPQSAAHDPMPRLLRAWAELQRGNHQEATALYEQAAQVSSSSVERARALGASVALELARWEDIEQWLPTATGEDPLLPAAMEARLRILDAAWLLTEGEARAHAPGQGQVEAIRQALPAMLQGLARVPLPPTVRQRIELRAAMAMGSHQDLDPTWAKNLATRDLSGQTLEALVIAHLKRNDPRAALNMLSLRDELAADGPWFDLLAGLCQMHLGQLELARHALQPAEGPSVLAPLAHYLKARTWLMQEDHQAALPHLQRAVESWPQEPAWQFSLAQAYMACDQLDAALPHLQQAVDLAPENPDYLARLGETLLQAGLAAQALEALERAMQAREEQDPELLLCAARAALASNKAVRAKRLFQQAAQGSAENPEPWIGAARAALAAGQTKEAVRFAKNALRRAPQDWRALLVMGDLQAALDRPQKAVEFYQRAKAGAADPMPIELAEARLLLRANRPAQAVELLHALTASAPQDGELWALLAKAQAAAGDLNAALKSARQATEIAPARLQYRLLMASLARQAGQLDRALAELDSLQEISPDDARLHLERGLILSQRRQLQPALESFERAIDLDPGCVEAYLQAAAIHKHYKRYSAAADMLKRAVEHDPTNATALHQLAAIRALELVHGGISQTAVN